MVNKKKGELVNYISEGKRMNVLINQIFFPCNKNETEQKYFLTLLFFIYKQNSSSS